MTTLRTNGAILQENTAIPVAAEDTTPPEVSIVMPCLNEADTLAVCIGKAKRALENGNIHGEIIVADNGSTDSSVEIAKTMGARVVHVETKGYGSALMGGITAARAKFIIMGDADDSYDFGDIGKFIEKLRLGFDLVQGCRLPAGGGKVMRGAMPMLHRWFGNPMFSFLVRRMFFAPIHDVYCGLRGFTRELYRRLDLHCTGMEFATEMIIKSNLHGMKIAEVPIVLYPDGRKSHPPHLKTFRDGWRTLRFFLLYCPRWLFLYPGAFLIALGVLGYALALPALTIAGVAFDAHTLLFSSLAILLGFQSIVFAILAKAFAIGEHLLPEDPRLNRLFSILTLERCLFGSAVTLGFGLSLLLVAVNQWRLVDFGNLDYPSTMRLVVPGVTLTALGFQTTLSSFFSNLLFIRRH
jgi:glycosyltransferase involved in cell wall biosynthesis